MTNVFVSKLNRTFRALAAAARAANAVESHRNPRTQDLKALGIDPTAFRDIRY